MDNNVICEYINSPTNLDSVSLKVLEGILGDYPYFQAARFLYLQNLSHVRSLRSSEELKKSAPFIIDRKQLFMALGDKEYAWSELINLERERAMKDSLEGESQQKDSFSLIDAFLASVADNSYTDQLEDIIQNQINYPTDDYVGNLLSIPDLDEKNPVKAEDGDNVKEGIAADASRTYAETENGSGMKDAMRISDNISDSGNISQDRQSDLNASDGFNLHSSDDKQEKPYSAAGINDGFNQVDNNPSETPQQIEDTSFKEKLSKQQSLIDSFIEMDSKEHIFVPMDDPSDDVAENLSKEDTLIKEDAFLTESLAKIYIKQKKYSKALEIIKKLSLKYPEKNIYFADQIRFLEKIIINIKTE